MNADRKDLMNEGWNAMEALLNEEMPKKSKNYNFLLLALLVFVAFSGGYWAGTSGLDNKQTLDLENIPTQKAVTAIPTSNQVDYTFAKETENPNQKVLSKTINTKATKNTKVSPSTIASNNQIIERSELANLETNKTSLQNFTIYSQEEQFPKTPDQGSPKDDITAFDHAMLLSPDQLLSTALAVSYLPRSNNRVKKATNWVLGLGLSSGINPGRNTKVASFKSEWMYKVGKDNSIGLELIYAAEDKFGFLNFGEEPTIERGGERGGKETTGRDKVEELIQNSRQFRYAAGLVLQQDFGYRFYSNLGAGVNLMQNSYSNELVYKSLNTIDDIKYHWGGYTSIAFGYRISRLIDFELSGTKSLLGKQGGEYQRGSTDQITGGLKISF